jgi:DNA-binding MarR family transcriptional regulator
MMYFHHMHPHLNRRADRFFGQGKVLTAILRNGPTTESELREIVDRDIPPLSEILSELEKRRLIRRGTQRRENSGNDKRGDVFSLTKRGELFAKRFQNLNRHADRFLYQGKVLMAIWRKGSVTQSELLEIIDSDPQHLSETLSELEKQRSIKRENNAKSKQGDIFSLTRTGEMKAGRFQIHDLFTRNMSGTLSNEEKGQLTAIIEKMHSRSGREEFSHFHFHGSHFDFGGKEDK